MVRWGCLHSDVVPSLSCVDPEAIGRATCGWKGLVSSTAAPAALLPPPTGMMGTTALIAEGAVPICTSWRGGEWGCPWPTGGLEALGAGAAPRVTSPSSTDKGGWLGLGACRHLRLERRQQRLELHDALGVAPREAQFVRARL